MIYAVHTGILCLHIKKRCEDEFFECGATFQWSHSQK
ncbi:hypothetical protein GGR38_004470 [Novosphingobium sediminicola]|uniref:Uncharacterized protein n=1 Tax=Novosphingobium sediminicola TaxID=563162 RepID=A0A7W6CJ41_9SPHN|nr:hypothetical protein [Novosphingobium sediminicola]